MIQTIAVENAVEFSVENFHADSKHGESEENIFLARRPGADAVT